MKTPSPPQSTTSLPRSPREDARARSTKYLVMMAVRIVCFALMVLITPFGWYTWVFAAGAVFLPYIAVIVANVGKDMNENDAVAPDRMLTAPESGAQSGPAPEAPPTVIRITESPARAADDESPAS